jgi:hypothetical protein
LPAEALGTAPPQGFGLQETEPPTPSQQNCEAQRETATGAHDCQSVSTNDAELGVVLVPELVAVADVEAEADEAADAEAVAETVADADAVGTNWVPESLIFVSDRTIFVHDPLTSCHVAALPLLVPTVFVLIEKIGCE